MYQKFTKLPSSKLIDICDGNFSVNDVDVEFFNVSHDAAHCLGYSIKHNQSRISVATDLGVMTDNILSNLIKSNLVVLEANHDITKLLNNQNYPLYLKNRILSNNGHLNNNASADSIVKMLGYNVRGIILAHLSEQNNSPELAFSTVANKLAQNGANIQKDIIVDVAHQEKVGNIFKIKE